MSIAHLFPQVNGTPRLATYEDISTYWPDIRKALKDIRREQGPRATWTPSHVLAAIRASQAELWLMIGEHDVLDAFVVTQTVVDPCLHVPTGLFVWMAHRQPHTPKRILVDAMDGFFTKLAAERGLLYTEAITCWEGLARSMGQRGWEIVGYVIRRQHEEP